MDDKNLYFKGDGFGFKLLRFFNLLEPGIAVLSISKILLWIMIFIMVFVLFTRPDDLNAILLSSASVTGTLMNYGYRRWIFYKTGKETTTKN